MNKYILNKIFYFDLINKYQSPEEEGKIIINKNESLNILNLENNMNPKVLNQENN